MACKAPSPGREGEGESLRRYSADLHIHTLLSPCAEMEMLPSLIVEVAQSAGLDIIAITDHNSCDNAGAVIEAATGSSIKVLPGLEVQSLEGVHLLCLFDELESAIQMQEAVYASLPNLPVGDKIVAEQMIVDARDEFFGYCEKPLSLPAMIDMDAVYEQVMDLGGMLIPSHIDRRATGLCGVLGMLPESPEFDAVEISANMTVDEARDLYAGLNARPVFQSSDAHWLSAIGQRRTVLYMEHRTLDEIRKACKGEGGRRVGDA